MRTVTVTESEWTSADRGWVLALLAEQADVCPQCGHPMTVCRDPATAGQWQVIEGVCQASRIAQAVAENNVRDASPRRGIVLSTRRTPPTEEVS
jgi:hypothetical protein